ncbi:hypothetical protein DER44DRAFT_229479 [Fusarium oxysporum]|nr:hypothetical protein DER44DRAFT_229479 [Fusarium oxysporum]
MHVLGLTSTIPRLPISSTFTTKSSIFTSQYKLQRNICTGFAMAIPTPCSIFCSFEGVVLSITAIHIVLTTLRNWICGPATPTPEELIRSRRGNHAGRSAVNRVAEAAPRPAADKHPYHRPCHSWWWYAMALWPARDDLLRKPRRKWWWYILALWPARDDPSRRFILTTAWSISILTFIFFLREISPDIYQCHVRFFTILSFLALEVGRAAYFYHLLKDCSVLVQEVCIGLMGHVTGGFCRLGSLFAVP